MTRHSLLTALLLAFVATASQDRDVALAAELSPPEKSFEALWQMFHDRYAFFELRGVDWKKQYETYRPRVSERTTDDELFKILCDMLTPLQDGHVTLKRKGKNFARNRPPASTASSMTSRSRSCSASAIERCRRTASARRGSP